MSLTYKKAGVDIAKADLFIKQIKPLVSRLNSKASAGQIGGFGGLFSFGYKSYKDPVLVSSADGVGTKLKLAFLLNKHDTVGIDLVAMNVNDILVCGAKPLFFLDYIACGKVYVKKMTDIVKGIVQGCKQGQCSLIGGETAEMPSFYKKDEYDLAGFCVGVVDKKDIIDGKKLKPGNVAIGIASSGLHSNGFSLARKVFTLKELKGKIGRTLLAPTKIYTNAVLALQKKIKIGAMAHITGGAFYEKLTKVIPKGLCVQIHKNAWRVPNIFKEIQKRGKVSEKQMYTTFNMGIGMVIIVKKEAAEKAQKIITKTGYKNWVIGEIVKGKDRLRLF